MSGQPRWLTRHLRGKLCLGCEPIRRWPLQCNQAGLEELRWEAALVQLARCSRGHPSSGLGRSWLEDHAVKPATLADYGRRMATLKQYCLTAGLPMGSRALDEVAFL